MPVTVKNIPLPDIALILGNTRQKLKAELKVSQESSDIWTDVELNNYEIDLIIKALKFTAEHMEGHPLDVEHHFVESSRREE